MKKIEMDISPLDSAIADVEQTLQSIELTDVYEHDDDFFDSLDFFMLDSNEEIKQELTGLSTLMSDLQHLLQKELGKVEEVQIKKAMEEALAKKQRVSAASEASNEQTPMETKLESNDTEIPLSRKAYRSQDKKNRGKSRSKREKRR